MFVQEKPGIYVYHTTIDIGCRLVTEYYETFSSLFLHFREYQLAALFGDLGQTYHTADNNPLLINARSKLAKTTRCVVYGLPDIAVKFYAAYDENGNLYTADRLVGMHRVWYKARDKRYEKNRKRRNGCKKRAWGSYRRIKTTQERRQCFYDPDALEMNVFIKMRKARNITNIPNSWDDMRTHNDKCWKTQSKREHQWR